MQRLLLGTVFIGVALLASGCKHLASENVTSRQLPRIQDEPAQLELMPTKQKIENDVQALSSPKLSKLERQLSSEYIGLTTKEARSLAQQQNRQFIINSEDGKSYPVIANFVQGRITASVTDGLVCSIRVEDMGFN